MDIEGDTVVGQIYIEQGTKYLIQDRKKVLSLMVMIGS
jgi:hypothetical protein